MFFMCEVCNGMEILNVSCEECGQTAEDRGRLGDLFDPYSAYRPINDIKRTNGLPDLAQRECWHIVHCRKCDRSFGVAVRERVMPG